METFDQEGESGIVKGVIHAVVSIQKNMACKELHEGLTDANKFLLTLPDTLKVLIVLKLAPSPRPTAYGCLSFLIHACVGRQKPQKLNVLDFHYPGGITEICVSAQGQHINKGSSVSSFSTAAAVQRQDATKEVSSASTGGK